MAEIIINTKIKKNRISPLLYGVFFEDINYGGDGGLYANLSQTVLLNIMTGTILRKKIKCAGRTYRNTI